MVKGWFNEPLRHSLARKGVRTGRKSYSRKPRLDFPTGKGNEIHSVIVVPSTKDFDKPVSRAEFNRRAREVESFMSKTLETEKGGGFTEVKAKGGWVEKEDGKEKVVREPVYEVHNYTTKEVWLRNDLEVKKFVEQKKKEWGQSSIGFQFEESMHFV
jgi:hypothetical protein